MEFPLCRGPKREEFASVGEACTEAAPVILTFWLGEPRSPAQTDIEIVELSRLGDVWSFKGYRRSSLHRIPVEGSYNPISCKGSITFFSEPPAPPRPRSSD
jgi:hypothetical protein